MLYKFCKRLSILDTELMEKVLRGSGIELGHLTLDDRDSGKYLLAALSQLTEEGERRYYFRSQIIKWKNVPYSFYSLITDERLQQPFEEITTQLKKNHSLENWHFLSDLLKASSLSTPEERITALNRVCDEFILLLNISNVLRKRVQAKRATKLQIEDFNPIIVEIVNVVNQNLRLNVQQEQSKPIVETVPTFNVKGSKSMRHTKTLSCAAVFSVEPGTTLKSPRPFFAHDPKILKSKTTNKILGSQQAAGTSPEKEERKEPAGQTHARSVSSKA
jgi:hypothetical protein